MGRYSYDFERVKGNNQAYLRTLCKDKNLSLNAKKPSGILTTFFEGWKMGFEPTAS